MTQFGLYGWSAMSTLPKICFTGTFDKTVDSKRRINLPAALTNQVPDRTFHIMKGQDLNLFVYPQEMFMAMAARLNTHFGFRGETDKEKRIYFMETMADAHPVQCDQQGRITVPQKLLEYAKIRERVLIIGAFDKLVLWNPDLYEEFTGDSQYTAQERVNQFGWAEREWPDKPETT